MTTMLQGFQNSIETARSQLATRFGIRIEMTDRAKALVAILAGVLVVSAWIGLARMADGAETRLHQAQSDLARVQNKVEFGSWSERKKQSLSLKTELESRFWTAQTAGLAEASFERWIRTQMSRAKIEPQQIQIQRSVMSPGTAGGADTATTERMTAKVIMPFQSAPLLAFLEAAAENGRIAMIERLSIRTGRNARAEMDIATFIRLSPDATDSPP